MRFCPKFRVPIQRRGFTATLGTVAIALFFQSSMALSAGSDRVDRLEQRLEQALTVIEALKAGDEGSGELEARVAEMEEIIEGVEDTVDNLDSKVGSRAVVSAFDALQLDLGGFFHLAGTLANGEDGTAASVNRQTVELLVKANLGDKWTLFYAQAFIRQSAIGYTDPAGRTDPSFVIGTAAPTVIAWGNYRFTDAFNVRAGRFITPHGIINVEHFPAILLEPEQPQFLRPFGGNTIFPNFLSGVNLHGKQFTSGGGSVDYSVYAGNFEGNAEHFNVGGRLAYNLGASGLTVGANVSAGERPGPGDQDYTLVGADVLYDKGPLLWKTEVFFTDEDGGGNKTAFYTQPAWRLTPKWTVFYRFDFLDNGGILGNTIEHVAGLTYRPNRSVHLRGVFTNKEFESGVGVPNEHVNIFQISATFSY